MDGSSSSYIMLVVIIVVFGGMMWWQSKKSKQAQQEKQDFRRNLQPGTEVITIGQVIGKVVEVDEQYEEIVIDSEGSKLRFGFNAIAREYVRPAYVSDDEALICDPKPSRRCFLTTAIPSMMAACSAKASRICAAWTPLVPVRYMSVSATQRAGWMRAAPIRRSCPHTPMYVGLIVPSSCLTTAGTL